MEYEPYYLGIDGGQSHTTALIANAEGVILGRGFSGASNHTRQPGGRERLERAVSDSVSDALRAAGLMDRGAIGDFYFHSAHLAMTGEPEDKIAIVEQILNAENLVVGHDAPGALAGALAGADGIIVLAGTGSVAYGEMQISKVSRREVRVGGNGFIFGDEGSGFWIGKESLRLAIHNEERGLVEDQIFKSALLTHFKRHQFKDIAEDFYAGIISREQLASFSKRIDRLVKLGDEVSIGLFNQAANDLAELAQATAFQLGATNKRIQISYGGGVFLSKFLLKQFKVLVKELLPKAHVTTPVFTPDIGALLLAYRQANRKITKNLLANLQG